MGNEVIMPQLGESVVEGTVTKWLKKEGETVEEFEPILEVNTDKVDTEIPSPAKGTVLKLYVKEGATVRAGTLLAIVGQPGDAVPEAPEEPAKEPAPAPEPAQPTPHTARPGKGELGFISPVVARMAAEHSIDLSQLKGTGHGGRISKKDVLAHLEKRKAEPLPWEVPASGELFRPTEEVFGPSDEFQPGSLLSLDAVRRSIADHMVRSKETSPHVTTVMEADMGRVIAHRSANKQIFARDGVNLTFTAYFVAAVVEGLKAVPIVNSSWEDEGIFLHKKVNVGVAVSLGERGLIVPVIKGADQMSLLAIARAVNDLAGRARDRQLKPDDVQGGTFTITNHGVTGSLFATPIINQPQSAILGVGKIQKRPQVIETQGPGGKPLEAIAIRPMTYLTLTFDHRILDGAVADHFLGKVVARLENWENTSR